VVNFTNILRIAFFLAQITKSASTKKNCSFDFRTKRCSKNVDKIEVTLKFCVTNAPNAFYFPGAASFSYLRQAIEGIEDFSSPTLTKLSLLVGAESGPENQSETEAHY
jgi:hypothetical protein